MRYEWKCGRLCEMRVFHQRNSGTGYLWAVGLKFQHAKRKIRRLLRFCFDSDWRANMEHNAILYKKKRNVSYNIYINVCACGCMCVYFYVFVCVCFRVIFLVYIYIRDVRIRDVALKTYQRQWTIGKSGERGSGISMLAAQHDDDDIREIWRKNWSEGVCDFLSYFLFHSLRYFMLIYIYIYIYIYVYICISIKYFMLIYIYIYIYTRYFQLIR